MAVYVVILLDWSHMGELITVLALKGEAQDTFDQRTMRKKWKPPKSKPNFWEEMAALAVAEYIYPRQFRSAEARASFLGVDERQYRRWGKIYGEVYSMLNHWVGAARRHITWQVNYG